MIEIYPIQLSEAEAYQKIFNHKEIIGHLGGFTHLETIKSKIKQSGWTLFGARYNENLAGCMMIAGRNQAHFAKFGEVGVLPEYRRKRISTCLYAAVIFQGILEGRRIWEDTIVGNNPFQSLVLPTLGIHKWGTLKQKTASFLDIDIYGLNLQIDTVYKLLDRIPQNCKIKIVSDYYSKDLFDKNLDIWSKKNPTFFKVIEYNYKAIKNSNKITIIKGQQEQEHNSGRNINQRELVL